MKTLFPFICAACATTHVLAGTVLYDNQPDMTGTALIDHDWPDFPSFSTFQVDDVTFNSPVIIHSVTQYFTVGYGQLQNATHGHLSIFVKNGSLPDQSDDPSESPLVEASFDLTTGEWSATGLSIELPAGSYWMGLTPEGDFATADNEFHWPGIDNNGTFAAIRNPGGGFGFGTEWTNFGMWGVPDADMAMTIIGEVIPAPGVIGALAIGALLLRRGRRE